MQSIYFGGASIGAPVVQEPPIAPASVPVIQALPRDTAHPGEQKFLLRVGADRFRLTVDKTDGGVKLHDDTSNTPLALFDEDADAVYTEEGNRRGRQGLLKEVVLSRTPIESLDVSHRQVRLKGYDQKKNNYFQITLKPNDDWAFPDVNQVSVSVFNNDTDTLTKLNLVAQEIKHMPDGTDGSGRLPESLALPAPADDLSEGFAWKVSQLKLQSNPRRLVAPPALSPALSEPSKVMHAFPGSAPVPTARYTVTIEDQQIDLLIPWTEGSRSSTIFAELSAEALAHLPTVLRKKIDQIEYSPNGSPYNDLAAKHLALEKFAAGADAHDRQITFYGWKNFDLDKAVVQSPVEYPMLIKSALHQFLAHESAHLFQQSMVGGIVPHDWHVAAWKDDALSSLHASRNDDEYFAETVELYLMCKGTSAEPQVRSVYKHQFDLLDRWFNED